MRLTKAQRQHVWAKSNGFCWYCGSHLGDRWHADHMDAIYRESDWIEGKPVPNGKCWKEHLHTIDNLVPACVPCNLFKGVFSIEEFRKEIEAQVKRARNTSVNFRTAERFGLITAQEKPVLFWFETNPPREPGG